MSDRRQRWDRQTEPENFEERERALGDLRRLKVNEDDGRPGLERARPPGPST